VSHRRRAPATRGDCFLTGSELGDRVRQQVDPAAKIALSAIVE
jgi:hypothetical protein